MEHWTPTQNPDEILIPGLDNNASDNDQIDQIDQLITIKLQNIDANLSKFHNTIHSRVLPALRRYAEATEPIRETARFWVEFFEMAANVRMVPPSETSAAYQESDHEPLSFNHTPSEDNSLITAAVSSTPMSQSHRRPPEMISSDTSDDPSWAISVESPFERLDRQLHGLKIEDGLPPSESLSSMPHSRLPVPVTQREMLGGSQEASVPTASRAKPMPVKGKEKMSSNDLRQDVLRQNMRTAAGNSTTPQRRNPFIPHGTDPKKWDGIVDLRQHQAVSRLQDDSNSDSDESDRSQTPSQINLKFAPLSPNIRATPLPNAAERVLQQLIASTAAGRGATSFSSAEPSSPSVPRARTGMPKKSLGFTEKLAAQFNWSSSTPQPSDEFMADDSFESDWGDDGDDLVHIGGADAGAEYETDNFTAFSGHADPNETQEETLFGPRLSFAGEDDQRREFMIYANQNLDATEAIQGHVGSPTPWTGVNRNIGN